MATWAIEAHSKVPQTDFVFESRSISSGIGHFCTFHRGTTLGPELRRPGVDFDRNYDNYDEFELRYRNFDNLILIGFKNKAALC